MRRDANVLPGRNPRRRRSVRAPGFVAFPEAANGMIEGALLLPHLDGLFFVPRSPADPGERIPARRRQLHKPPVPPGNLILHAGRDGFAHFLKALPRGREGHRAGALPQNLLDAPGPPTPADRGRRPRSLRGQSFSNDMDKWTKTAGELPPTTGSTAPYGSRTGRGE
jgi:hypothetical protein